MPAQLEFLVSILEIAAFLLVTPEVIGRNRMFDLYFRLDSFGSWFKEVWFKRSNRALLAFVAYFVIAIVAAFLFARSQSYWWVLLPSLVAFVLPLGIVFLHRFLRYVRDHFFIVRTMTLIGAALFLTGRFIVLGSAWSRM